MRPAGQRQRVMIHGRSRACRGSDTLLSDNNNAGVHPLPIAFVRTQKSRRQAHTHAHVVSIKTQKGSRKAADVPACPPVRRGAAWLDVRTLALLRCSAEIASSSPLVFRASDACSVLLCTSMERGKRHATKASALWMDGMRAVQHRGSIHHISGGAVPTVGVLPQKI